MKFVRDTRYDSDMFHLLEDFRREITDRYRKDNDIPLSESVSVALNQGVSTVKDTLFSALEL